MEKVGGALAKFLRPRPLLLETTPILAIVGPILYYSLYRHCSGHGVVAQYCAGGRGSRPKWLGGARAPGAPPVPTPMHNMARTGHERKQFLMLKFKSNYSTPWYYGYSLSQTQTSPNTSNTMVHTMSYKVFIMNLTSAPVISTRQIQSIIHVQ